MTKMKMETVELITVMAWSNQVNEGDMIRVNRPTGRLPEAGQTVCVRIMHETDTGKDYIAIGYVSAVDFRRRSYCVRLGELSQLELGI